MSEQDKSRLRLRPDGNRDDSLARLLRAADPAADAELDAVARAELRRTVLDAASRQRSSSAWEPFRASWVTVATAAAVLVAGVGLAFLLLRDVPMTDRGDLANRDVGAERHVTPVPDVPQAPTKAVSPQNADAGPLQPAATSAVATAPPTNRGETAVVATDPAPAPATMDTGVATRIPSSVVDRPLRTLHLTAPRGTRIIWTLDPSYESPIDGQTPRQEKTP